MTPTLFGWVAAYAVLGLVVAALFAVILLAYVTAVSELDHFDVEEDEGDEDDDEGDFAVARHHGRRILESRDSGVN